MLLSTSLLFALVLALVVFTTPATASDAVPSSPSLRSSVPSHVAAPHQSEPKPVRVIRERASASDSSEKSSVEKVNINTADVKTLMTLPGVNRKVAQQIVAYREEHGPFKRASELRKVEGVGDTLWEKNRRRIVTK